MLLFKNVFKDNLNKKHSKNFKYNLHNRSLKMTFLEKAYVSLLVLGAGFIPYSLSESEAKAYQTIYNPVAITENYAITETNYFSSFSKKYQIPRESEDNNNKSTNHQHVPDALLPVRLEDLISEPDQEEPLE